MSTNTRKASIRNAVCTHLVAGTPRPQIYAMLKRDFEGTQAAAKCSVHVSWYAGWLKKNPDQVSKFEGVILVAVPTAEEAAVILGKEPKEAGPSVKDVTELVEQTEGTDDEAPSWTSVGTDTPQG